MKQIKWAAAAGAICCLLLSGCGPEPAAETKPPLVKVIAAGETNSGMQDAVYSGTVAGRYEANLAFQVSGKIVSRSVDVGDRVSAGQVLMTIDSRDIDEQLLAAAGALDGARSSYELAKTNLARYQALYAEQAVSTLQLDQARNQFDVAASALRQAEAEYTVRKNQKEYTALVSDRNGVVRSLMAEAGQVAAAGTPVAVVVGEGDMEAVLSIPEQRYGQIQIGDTFAVRFWALPGVTVQGTVREKSPAAAAGMQTYTVRLTLVNPPPEVQLGMTVSADMGGAGRPAGLVIPVTALVDEGGRPSVWIVKEDNTVEKRAVETGVFGQDTVEIHSGLTAQDRIVVKGAKKLTAGQKVRT